MVVELGALVVQIHVGRFGNLVEPRVEIVRRGDEEPLISLSADDAAVLGFMLRRNASMAGR